MTKETWRRIRAVTATFLVFVVISPYACDGGTEPPDPYCGDGSHDIETEECDDGELNSDTEPGACRLDCTLPYCGDGLCDPDEEWTTCEGDCPGVGSPCDPDDPNACAGLRAAGLEPECVEVLTDASNNDYLFPGGYCTATCDVGYYDVCPGAGGICAPYHGKRCLMPCTTPHSTDCRAEEGYVCCHPYMAVDDFCVPENSDCMY